MSDDLSPRERECVQLAAGYLTDKEIAVRLGISPKTVRNTLTNAYRKLGVTTRREAARRLGHDVPRASTPIPPEVQTPPISTAFGVEPMSLSRSWPLSAPPSGTHRIAVILAFMVAGAFVSLVSLVTIWTVIDVVARRAPPNAIQALDGGSPTEIMTQ